MCRNILFATVVCLFFVISCKDADNRQTIELSLSEYSEESGTCFLEQHLCAADAIPLDSSEVFRVKNVDRAIISGGEIYILDSSIKKLVSYNLHDRSPVAVYGKRGRAGYEYLQITAFDIDPEGNIWILDAQGDKLLKYSHRGEFISKTDMPFDAMDIKCVDNDNFLLAVLPKGNVQKNKARIFLTDTKLQTQKVMVSYSENFDADAVLSTFCFTPLDENTLFSSNLYIDDYVHKMDLSGRMLESYHFDFGDMAFPMEYRKNITSHQDCFGQCRCICPPVTVTNRFCVGNMFNKGVCSFFVADRNENKIYISEIDSPYKLVGTNSKTAIFYSAVTEELLFLNL